MVVRNGRSYVSRHDLLIAASTIWVVVTAVLVMFMQAGFAFLEAGLTRMKNAGHIAGKNVLTFAVASLVYWAVGFGIAFGDGNALVGTDGFFPSVNELISVGKAPFDLFSEIPGAAGYLFEVVFAGVSLAIVWGAMAERATRRTIQWQRVAVALAAWSFAYAAYRGYYAAGGQIAAAAAPGDRRERCDRVHGASPAAAVAGRVAAAGGGPLERRSARTTRLRAAALMTRVNTKRTRPAAMTASRTTPPARTSGTARTRTPAARTRVTGRRLRPGMRRMCARGCRRSHRHRL